MASLAGGFGDATAIEVLRNGQYNRMLQALASIMEIAPTELTRDAITLLDAARDASEERCFEALSYPYVGTWARVCLEQLMGLGSETSAIEHVLHLNSVAAVAAYRCGIDFELSVPSRQGRVALPGLGVAITDSEGGSATACCLNGQLSIHGTNSRVDIPQDPNTSSEEWLAVREVTSHCDDMSITLAIDDLDPYRGHFPFAGVIPPSDRLDDIGYKTWCEMISDAWMHLVINYKPYTQSMSSGLRVITPLEETNSPRHDRSPNAFGSVAIANVSHRWLAYGMLDGFQRTKISALDYLFPLHRSTVEEASCYAPWTIVPQSFRAFFEAAYAAPAVATYWRTEATKAVDAEERCSAEMHFVIWRSRLDHLKQELKGSNELTALGRKFVEELPSSASLESIDEFSPSIIELARMTEIDGRISWRLQNLMPDSVAVNRISAAWLASRPCPMDMTIESRAKHQRHLVRWRSRRWLGLRRIADPDWFQQIASNQGYLGILDNDAHISDAQMVDGQIDTVVRHCIDEIAIDSGNHEAWALLALAVRDQRDMTAYALTRFPETVMSVYCAISRRYGVTTDPLGLAFWMAPLLLRQDDRLFTPGNSQ
jgi:HEXXH motif-containing protein